MTTSRRSLLKLLSLAPIAAPAAAAAFSRGSLMTRAEVILAHGMSTEGLFEELRLEPSISYPEFVSQLHDKIARSLGIPYEQLVADFAPNRLYGADINADGDAI